MKTYDNDLSILATCAFRYALGRRTYMPSAVQQIIKNHINEIDTLTISIIIKELEECRDFGDPYIDKPGWLSFSDFMKQELAKRDNI